MTIDEYADWANKVTPARLGVAASTEERQLMYLVLALAGEIGEVADHVKKVLRDDTWDRDRLAPELGDVAWARPSSRVCAWKLRLDAVE